MWFFYVSVWDSAHWLPWRQLSCCREQFRDKNKFMVASLFMCSDDKKTLVWAPCLSVIPCWGLSGGVAVWTVAADNPTLCELALPYNGSIVETHSPGRRDWVYTRCREVWVQGARVQGLQQQWVNQRRAVFWWSADNGTRSETREICATFHMVLVQIMLYVPTIATCVSAQIHLACDQISENRFLIRAIVSLIFLKFFIISNGIQCRDYQLQPEASPTSILRISDIFWLFSDCRWKPKSTWCSPDLFTQTVGSSPQSLSTKPFFYPWATTVLLDLQLNLFFPSVLIVVSVHKKAFILPCLRVTGLSGQADGNLCPA